MANEVHLAILELGTKVWNEWREENPDVRPDLSGATLIKADLHRSNLRSTSLNRATLNGADLNWADLNESDLNRATLRGTILHHANLYNVSVLSADFSGANLRHANLKGANLSHANLFRADVCSTNLRGANLKGADFYRASLGWTILANVDLSEAKGLEKIRHRGPSTIGVDTIYASRGKIPESFLRGAGVPENFITYMHSLTGEAFKFYSCFICHSSKDKEFVERLYADLQSNSVRCWYAPRDMQIGAPILNEIDDAIRLHDKLLLILSENSVSSRWVEHEVLSATTKEYQQGQESRMLFPIRLDNVVMDTDVTWAKSLRDKRHIADFTQWKDHDSYRAAFDRLLRDLKGTGVSETSPTETIDPAQAID